MVNFSVFSNQGAVFLTGAVIENADVAVNAGSNNTALRGGIIQAINSQFINNRFGIVLPPYRWQNANNVSSFYGCEFVTNADLHSENPNPRTHMMLFGVRGVRIGGCEFANTRAGTTNDFELGDGIFAVDASFTVDDFCGSFSGTTCTDFHESSFTNLRHGINLGRLLNPQACVVRHTEFDHCIRSIRNEGVNFVTFIGNRIAVGNPSAITDITNFSTALLDEGIIIRHATGFTVEGNSIEPALDANNDPEVQLTIGIRADGTGGDHNLILNNSFSEIAFANLANRQNRNILTPPFAGLEYLCNQNEDNGFDICVTAPIAGDPTNGSTGIQQAQGSESFAAGNSFTDDVFAGLQNEGNFFNHSDNFSNYHFFTGINPPPAAGFFTLGMVVPLPAINPSGCPSPGNNGGNDFSHLLAPENNGALLALYSANNALMLSEKATLVGLIDGGNTSAMLAYLETYDAPSDSVAVYDTLLALSPYLSTRLLERAAQKPSSIPNFSMFQILLSNPDAIQTARLITNLERRSPPMPQLWIDSILNNRDSITPRTYLEDSILRHTAKRNAAAYEMINRIGTSGDSIDHVLLRGWLDSLDCPTASIHKAFTYMETDHPDTVLAKLRLIPGSFALSYEDSIQLQSLDSVVEAYRDWFVVQTDTNLIAGDITGLDSLTLALFDTLASSGNPYLPGTQAIRNAMNFAYNKSYFTEAQLPEGFFAKREQTSSVSTEPAKKPPISPITVKVYPNPAKDHVVFEVNQPSELLRLEVYDILSKKMAVHELTQSEVTLDTKDWGSGLYLWRVTKQTKTVKSGKLQIIKW